MRIAVFDAQPLEVRSLQAANSERHALQFVAGPLGAKTVASSSGCAAVCVANADGLDADCLAALRAAGVRFVALRGASSAGLDVAAAQTLDLKVARVPAYSPDVVAEHAVTMVLTLARKLHWTDEASDDDLETEAVTGAALRGKCVGIFGLGPTAHSFAKMMRSFGCRMVAASPDDQGDERTPESSPWERMSPEQLLATADVVSLHSRHACPGCPSISDALFTHIKPGCMLVNTSRGSSLDLRAAMAALRSGTLGALGLDLYEDERTSLLEPGEPEAEADELLARLLSFPNVIVSGHQSFFSREARENVAAVTINNLSQWEETGTCDNLVKPAEQT